MSVPAFLAQARQNLAVGASLVALVANLGAPLPAAAQEPRHTATPIEHVIMIIGENRTFDHVFATYRPKAGQSISNLLSKGIVNADGTPGPNFSLASQSEANDTSRRYQIESIPATLPTPCCRRFSPADTQPPPFPMWRRPSCMRTDCRAATTFT